VDSRKVLVEKDENKMAKSVNSHDSNWQNDTIKRFLAAS
jgi:hypothetical protein